MQFADPTSDIGFKKLFVNPKHKNILISFLNSLLERTGDKRIVDAIASDTNNLPVVTGDRHSIVDVRCTDERGKQYIVEVQREDEKDFSQRCMYYSARALAVQLQETQAFQDIVPVIFLGVLNFNLFDGPDYISHHLIMNNKTHAVALNAFEWHFAELLKFDLSEKEIKTDTDRWMFLLNNAAKLDHVPTALNECKETNDAMRVLDKHLWTKGELERYDRMLDAERVARSVLATAVEKGEAKGKAKGLAEGKAKGLAEGKAKGLAEGMLKAAKQMLAKGADSKFIQEVTGLSAEEIAKLM